MSREFKNNSLFILISVLITMSVMSLVFHFFYPKLEQSKAIASQEEAEKIVPIEEDTDEPTINNANQNDQPASTSDIIEAELDKILAEEQTEQNIENETEDSAQTEEISEIVVNNSFEDEEVINNKDEDAETKTEPVAEPFSDSTKDSKPVVQQKSSYQLMLKDVGEPYLDRFGLGPLDFQKMQEMGVDIIEGNFDICASPSDVLIFLESAKDAGIKVIMPAGSGEAEWGYPCDDDFDENFKPQWQKERVQAWVKKWSYHPAIYAWDISNEDGQNFPNAQEHDEDWVKEGDAISLQQLQTAYKDVKEADPSRPIMIRMNGWYFYDYDSNFFRTGNAFGSGVADIVMVNAYSNVDEYFSDFVSTVASRAERAVRSYNPQAKIIVALGAWKEDPLWQTPTINHFINDVDSAKQINNILGIAIFKYGAEDTEWWMPESASEIWNSLPTIFSK